MYPIKFTFTISLVDQKHFRPGRTRYFCIFLTSKFCSEFYFTLHKTQNSTRSTQRSKDSLSSRSQFFCAQKSKLEKELQLHQQHEVIYRTLLHVQLLSSCNCSKLPNCIDIIPIIHEQLKKKFSLWITFALRSCKFHIGRPDVASRSLLGSLRNLKQLKIGPTIRSVWQTRRKQHLWSVDKRIHEEQNKKHSADSAHCLDPYWRTYLHKPFFHDNTRMFRLF